MKKGFLFAGLALALILIFSSVSAVFADDSSTPETMSIKVTTVWEDDDESLRPDALGFMLTRSSTNLYSNRVIATRENDYSFTFTNAPVNDEEGNPENYALEVVYSPRYSTTVTGNAKDGFIVTATPKDPQTTTVTLTKDLKGTSKEKEFGIYLLPIRHNIYYSPKAERRYPNGFGMVTLQEVSKFLEVIKEYDKTSGNVPLYPLYSKLFDEEFIHEKLQTRDALIEQGKPAYDHNVLTAEEYSFIENVIYPYFWAYYSIDDIGVSQTINNFDFDDMTEEMRAYYERWLNRGLGVAVYLDETDFTSMDEWVQDQVMNNRVFYTTIKAGDTKTVEIPASEVVSLLIVEVDYEDTEEFENIYFNAPVRKDGYFGNLWTTEGKSEFEYTLTNIGQPIPAKLALSGTKTLENKALTDKQFTFVLKEGKTVIDEAACDADGKFSFKAIEYAKEGEHTYTIEEKNDGQKNVTYDTHKETVKVTVTKNEDNAFVAEAAYDEDGIAFTNTFNEEKVDSPSDSSRDDGSGDAHGKEVEETQTPPTGDSGDQNGGNGSSGSSTGKSAGTGDDFGIAGFLALLLASGAAIGVIRRRRATR